MTEAVAKCLTIYESLKKDPSRFHEIESYSLLLHEELEDQFKESLPLVFYNYQDLKNRAENLIGRGYKFEVKDNKIIIVSPHPNRMNITHKLFNPKELLGNLSDGDLTDKEESLAILFLSNQNSILYLNVALNLF